SQQANTKRLQKSQGVIEAKEEIAPRPELLASWQPQISLLGAERIQLMQLLFAGENARRLEMIDNGKRQEHGATPGRHFVNVKWRPLWEEYHLHWNCRQILPREDTE